MSGKVQRVRKSKWLVKVGAIVATATLLLTGCGGDTQADAGASSSPSESVSTSATPTVQASALSSLDLITVTGDGQPVVDAPWPFFVEETQVRVISEGTGSLVQAEDSVVEVDYLGINARTGVTFDASWFRANATTFSLNQVVAGFSKAILNQRVGARVLVAMTGADGYDPAGGNANIGVEMGDTLVFVIDIRGVALDAPDGETIAPVAGLPTVDFVDGSPQVTVPAGQNAPTGLVVQPLIKGSGRAAVASDVISVRYQIVDWNTGKVLVNTFNSDPKTGLLSNMIPGWREGLVGQTAGSRVLMVVPPELAYPDGNQQLGIEKGATLVFVIDLLFLQVNA